MNYDVTCTPIDEQTILDFLSSFKLTEIPSETKFWMIRTKKGYFYQEFLTRKYVALAWNAITEQTSFENESTVADNILMQYPEIKRPKLVINKCKSFIYDVKPNDILVIPSKGSSVVTFAFAGEYFEESDKTVELENTIIKKIENKEVEINDVYCPYRKRRHIQIIRTIKSEFLNYHLYRAISSYHGINSLDAYSTIILDQIYNYYSFKDDVHLIFNVTKEEPIGLTELSKMLYSTTDSLTKFIPERNISTKLALQSPGDIVIAIENGFQWLSSNYLILFGMVILIGGGSFLTVKFPGAINVIKQILTLKISADIEKEKLQSLQLDNYEKKIKIYQQIKEAGINPADLEKPLTSLSECAQSMRIQAALSPGEAQIILPEDVLTDDADEEII